MPRVTRRGRKPKTQTEDTVKLSLKDIEDEIDDPTLFMGGLAYKNLQKTYIDKPKEQTMTLKEFETAIGEFKKQKIYKTTPIEVQKEPDGQQTPVVEDKQGQKDGE